MPTIGYSEPYSGTFFEGEVSWDVRVMVTKDMNGGLKATIRTPYLHSGKVVCEGFLPQLELLLQFLPAFGYRGDIVCVEDFPGRAFLKMHHYTVKRQHKRNRLRADT